MTIITDPPATGPIMLGGRPRTAEPASVEQVLGQIIRARAIADTHPSFLSAVKQARPWEHRPDHAHRLTDLSSLAVSHAPEAVSVEAVVVPAGPTARRSRAGLRHAARQANAVGAELVILCSDRAGAERAEQAVSPWPVKARIVVTPTVHPDWAGAFRLRAADRPGADTGYKRNIALGAAVALGWRRVLFLDDDLRPAARADRLDPTAIRYAARCMRERDLAAVGWRHMDFPDNSVVCHAARLAGRSQGVFLGGGALMVRVDARLPYFPDEYNEDWLFLIALARRQAAGLRSLGVAGTSGQDAYDPYVAERVHWQEFGDTVAEVLMNLLEDGAPLRQSVTFWRNALDSRRAMLAEVAERLSAARPSAQVTSEELGRARAAVQGARLRSHRTDPTTVARWVRRWDALQLHWTNHLQRLAGGCDEGRYADADELFTELVAGKPPKLA